MAVAFAFVFGCCLGWCLKWSISNVNLPTDLESIRTLVEASEQAGVEHAAEIAKLKQSNANLVEECRGAHATATGNHNRMFAISASKAEQECLLKKEYSDLKERLDAAWIVIFRSEKTILDLRKMLQVSDDGSKALTDKVMSLGRRLRSIGSIVATGNPLQSDDEGFTKTIPVATENTIP